MGIIPESFSRMTGADPNREFRFLPMQRQADTRARFHGAVESLVVLVGKVAVCVTPVPKHEADRCSRATRDPRHGRIAGLRVSPTPPATVHDAYRRS